MAVQRCVFNFVTFCLLICNGSQLKFERYVSAVGFPYYKLLMTLGACKDKVIFDEQKVWANVRLNRIFDIRYSSGNEMVKVSMVEIRVVINNTDCYALSERGVGYSDFAATLIVPTGVAVMFYRLSIYTCSHVEILDHVNELKIIKPDKKNLGKMYDLDIGGDSS